MENYRIFDSELDKLRDRVFQMSVQVNRQLIDVVAAISTCDLQLAKKVINNDEEINNLDTKIDKLCQKIFALQHPVASDLRYIMSSLKINNDLERIGDHAVNIAKKIGTLLDYPQLVEELGIDNIGDKTVELFADVLSLISSLDITFADKILDKADKIDIDCKKIIAKIFQEKLHQPEVVEVAANILIIINLFERVASYSTNITEAISFVVDGEIIKHKKRK